MDYFGIQIWIEYDVQISPTQMTVCSTELIDAQFQDREYSLNIR